MNLKIGDWVEISGAGTEPKVENFVGQIIKIFKDGGIQVAGPKLVEDSSFDYVKISKNKNIMNLQFIQWYIGEEDILTIYN